MLRSEGQCKIAMVATVQRGTPGDSWEPAGPLTARSPRGGTQLGLCCCAPAGTKPGNTNKKKSRQGERMSLGNVIKSLVPLVSISSLLGRDFRT